MRRLFAIFLAVLALAGCGSENGGDAPDAPAGTTPATTQEDGGGDYDY